MGFLKMSVEFQLPLKKKREFQGIKIGGVIFFCFTFKTINDYKGNYNSIDPLSLHRKDTSLVDTELRIK